jgi:hypothetical protein
MNTNKKAFDRFLKYNDIWYQYYDAFHSYTGRRWRFDHEYEQEEEYFFENEDPESWIGSAFSWNNHGGDELWSELSNTWNDVYYLQSKRFYLSCKVPQNIKVV